METLSKVSKCLICSSEYTKKTYNQLYCSKNCNCKAQRQKRQEYLNKVKTEKGCAKCGYNEHPAALQFNHLDRSEKSFNIGEYKTLSMETINKEIDKCEVLCTNCHAIYTQQNHYTRMGTA